MISAIRKSCVLAVMAAGLSASLMSDVSEARGGRGGGFRGGNGGGGFRGGHAGGGFRHAGGFRNNSPSRVARPPARRTAPNHPQAGNARRNGVTPRQRVVPQVRRGAGRNRAGNGNRIAGRSRRGSVRRWRDRLRWRHHRWGIGRRHWRRFYFDFGFVMQTEDYANPYCGGEGGDGQDGGNAGGCYDYNQPVTGDSQPTDEGVDSISQADAAFQKGDYETALSLTEKAIRQMPKNADLHQFRSLALFALKRYRESATAAHAALAGGKGWNWQTLRGFYPSKDVYTAQLRNLESFVGDNAKNAAGQFLLGYHYMMMGHSDAAGSRMATVVKLEPRDKLAARMLAGISQKTGKQYAVAADAGSQPMNPTPAKINPSTLPMDDEPLQHGSVPAPKSAAKSAAAFNIVGNWKATDDGTVITLTFSNDGKFQWSAKEGDKSFAIDGTYTLVNNQLKMTSPKEKQPLEGTLTAKSSNEFELKLKDADKDEPALTFKRQS